MNMPKNFSRKSLLCLAILLSFITLSLAGCATKMTSQGQMVRQISPDGASKCKFLGVIEVEDSAGIGATDHWRGAMNQIRNRAAAMGGNAYVLLGDTLRDKATSGSIAAQADVYNCP